MNIAWIEINGFRNFKKAHIELNNKTLIIGANDVGKSNLLYALRILFDKTLNENDINLTESDFYMYDRVQYIEITVKISNIKEECLIAHFGGAIKDGIMFIKYSKHKNQDFEIFQGFDKENLTKIEGRTYLRRLNMKYVSTNRDLENYIKKERKSIINHSLERLMKENPKKYSVDIKKVHELNKDLHLLNDNISKLGYISESMKSISGELNKLSIHNEPVSVSLIAGNNDIQKMLDNLDLCMINNHRNVAVGGDGRKNQIFLASWAANNYLEINPSEVSFVVVEEPEAHLHPHQQRKLAKYLLNNIKGCLYISSHSPQIATEFSPDSIVKLDFQYDKGTVAANNGCNKKIKNAFDDLAYRLNIIATECFFANVVILVEGPSEVLLYKALSQEIGIDLDRFNISIISVDGVVFSEYINVLDSMGIKWIIRTDNDISKVPYTPKYRATGIKRGLDVLSTLDLSCSNPESQRLLKEFSSKGEWDTSESTTPIESKAYIEECRVFLKKNNIIVSTKDLENDLVNSPLYESLKGHYDTKGKIELIKKMQSKKALNMYEYLKNNLSELKKLESHDISYILYIAKNLAESVFKNGLKKSNRKNLYKKAIFERRRVIESNKRTKKNNRARRKRSS